MTIQGETVATGAQAPGTKIQVLQSAAGFYIGYLDEEGYPYSRESDYYVTAKAAQAALDADAFIRF
jgi:hypothetical protein